MAVASVLGALALGSGCQRAAPAHAQAPSPATAAPAGAAAPTLDVSSLVENVKASVVNITVEHGAQASSSSGVERGSPFDFFFPGGPESPPLGQKRRALGSGFIIDAQGHVVTNAHVVEGVDKVRVKLADERELDAKVKGRDRKLDIALLEVEVQGAKDLPYAALGSAAAMKVGEPVVAIGNPFGLGHTVTTGIVSAKGRAIGAGPYDDFVQTDASINPGNSGGPLFDLRGRVVGMNTAINPAGQGIGFAIPADAIKEILPQLLSKGRVDRGRIGVHIQEIDDGLANVMSLGTKRGALVGDVERNGPADTAGVKTGDVIVGVDGHEVAHAHDLPRIVARNAPGTQVKLELLRSGAKLVAPITLAPLDDEHSSGSSSEGPGGDSAHGAGSIGIEVGDAEGSGALVKRVFPGGPAADVLRPGDVIVEVNREPVRSASELVSRARKSPGDKPILLRVKRDDSSRWVVIERPRK